MSAVESLDQIQTPNEWHLLQLGNSAPTPRARHGAAVAGRRMFIVGGASADGFLDDVQVLHAEKRLWSRFNCYRRRADATPGRGSNAGNGPQLFQPLEQGPQCVGHHVAIWEKQLFVLGGQTDSTSSNLSVHVLDLETHSWSVLTPKGDVPTGRSGQSTVQVGSMLVVFGGEDAKGRILNDTHIFDLKSLVWLPLKTTGTKPAPRRNHSAACYFDRFLWVFGGTSRTGYFNDLHCLDFQTMEWTREKLKGPIPKPRAGQASVISGSKWYLVGGEFRGKEVQETMAFDLEKREWSVVTSVRPGSPLANDGLSVVKVRSKGKSFFLAFGGHGAVLSNQVYGMLPSLSARLGEECKSENSMNSLSMSFNYSSTSLVELTSAQEGAPRDSPKKALLGWDTAEAADNGALNASYDRERDDASSVGYSDDFGSSMEHPRDGRTNTAAVSHSGNLQMQDGRNSTWYRSSRTRSRSDQFSYTTGDLDQDESKEDLHNNDQLPRSNSGSIFAKVRKAVEVLQDVRVKLKDPRPHGKAVTTSLSNGEEIRGNHQQPDISDTDGFESDADSAARRSGEAEGGTTVARLKSAQFQEKLSIALAVNEELEGRLAEARRTNYETQKALQAALAENEELGKKLTAAVNTIEELEEESFTLLKSKSETEKKLKVSLKALEEADKKLQLTSQLQEDAEIRLRSTLRLKEDAEKKLAIQAKRLEDAEGLCADKDSHKSRITELERRLDEKEKHLAYAMKNQAVAEAKLVTAMKEKRELKERVLGAMHQQEEARAQSRATNAENERLEMDLVQLRAALKEARRELQAKELQLNDSHSQRFELQVELFEVKQKLRTTFDATTPASHSMAATSVIVQ